MKPFLVASEYESGKLQVAIGLNNFTPQEWGLILCDFARHIAKSFPKGDEQEILDEIKEWFEKEWNRPTTTIERVDV